MTVRRTLLLPLISIVLACSPGSQAQEPSSTLKKVGESDLPEPHGKSFDYLTIDSADHDLISAHLAAGQTYVIDLRTNKVVATVADTPGAEGVEYVSELKKFYTSNAGDNTTGVDGYCEHPGSKREHSLKMELSSGQRRILHLYRRPTVRQPGCRKPAAVLRKSLCHQVHILVASVR
jgi:hypothetical protein